VFGSVSTSALACVIALGVLCWTWLGYPAVVWLLSRVRPRDPDIVSDALPTVTAVLATRDDVESIVARVMDFLAADYPADRLSVVVGVDGAAAESLDAIRAATDSTRVTIVRADAGVGKVAGLNAAVRAATGEVLVFSDTQQRFATDAIRRLVSQLVADPRLGAVGGALQLPGDLPGATGRSPVEWYWALERRLRAAEARIHSCVGVSGSIYATLRSTWEPMPPQLILDDVWLPMRLVLRGKRIGYDLKAKAWDSRSTTSAAEKVRKVRTLTGNFQLMAWMPGVLVPFRNPIFVQFVSHKLLRLLTPWLLLLLLYGAAGMLLSRIGSDAMLVLVSILAALAVVVLLWPATRGKLFRALAWGWSLQAALVEATMNGVRGRWDVWR
jgi:cellulose synthase/poly-beta-1,6-N-acetylglucosamine synthase-like glycosyltransferase